MKLGIRYGTETNCPHALGIERWIDDHRVVVISKAELCILVLRFRMLEKFLTYTIAPSGISVGYRQPTSALNASLRQPGGIFWL